MKPIAAPSGRLMCLNRLEMHIYSMKRPGCTNFYYCDKYNMPGPCLGNCKEEVSGLLMYYKSIFCESNKVLYFPLNGNHYKTNNILHTTMVCATLSCCVCVVTSEVMSAAVTSSAHAQYCNCCYSTHTASLPVPAVPSTHRSPWQTTHKLTL